MEMTLMSQSQISSAGLDERRRRALFRSRHRGMHEMDIIMGGFADAEILHLDETELEAFELLLDLPDHEVFSWLTGEVKLPPEHDTAVFHKLLARNTHKGPIAF
jgi:antitoxin CptB